MSAPPQLSLISDPVSLGKIQVLVIPVHLPDSQLSGPVYEHWASLIRRHTTLRGDEIRRPYSPASGQPNGHTRGTGGENIKARFFPPPSGTSISKTACHQHVHLTYPSHPPARHLYPLSLLRMASFPLVVIGVAVDPIVKSAQGYSLNEEDEGQVSTPHVTTRDDTMPSTDTSQRLDEAIAGLFPDTSPFPLVRRLILVPPIIPSTRSARSSPVKSDPRAAAQAALEGRGEQGINVLRAPAEACEGWVGRAMGEVIGEVLSELGETAAALETAAGLKTLSATLLPSLTSHVAGSSVDTIYASGKTSTPILELPQRTGSASTPTEGLRPGPSISRALTPGGRPVSVQAPSLPPLQTNVPSSSPPVSSASANPFRRSTAISSPFSRTPSAASISSSSSAQSLSATASASQRYTSAPLAGLAGGRLMKLLGDMYLLAGMYADAIKCFDDGAERCRTVGDVLWEGLAREGRAVAGIAEAWEGRDGSNSTTPFPASPIPNEIQAHFLSALACIARAPLPYPPTILSPSPQAVSGSLSFAGPSTGGPTNIGTGEGLLAYLHVNLTLRIAHFMLTIWASGGWGSIALSCLMGHSLPRSFPAPPASLETHDPIDRRKRRKELATMSYRSQIPRHEVYAQVESALGTYHQAMTKTERLALLVQAVWMARWLDMPRKEATVTRALAKQLAILVVEGREESRRAHSTRHTKQAESASASVGLGLGMSVSTPRVAVRRRDTIEGNDSIVHLLERVISTLGVGLLSFSDMSPESGVGTSVLKHYGWPDLQVETIKEAIAISEVLPDHPNILRLAISALHHLYPFLPPPSQSGLARLLPQSLGVIRRRGIDFGNMPWWIPGKVVLSVEVASMSGNRIPREHAREEIVDGKKDFFLYNPRPKITEAGKTVIVAKEQVDVFVTVHNPLAFDLEVADLSLITSGTALTTSPLPIIIPASSVQTVRISAIASQPGTLQIKGASLRLHDGSSTEVLLPVIDDKEKAKRDKRRSRLSMDVGKVKRSGTEARHSLQLNSTGNVESDEGKWLECEVVEEQPLVWIKKTSLTHGTVMLYHGESTVIRLVLENSSSTPVDLIKLSFDDSTAREAQAVIADGELSPEHAYELDWDQIHRPALTWENPNEISIAPGGRTTLLIRCLGKVGCTDGSIRIDYGYANRPESTSKSFHTRQITFPLLFTVYHTFEPHSLDLLRFEPSTSRKPTETRPIANGSARPRLLPASSSQQVTPRRTSFAVTAEDELKRHLEQESNDEYCLASLSVRNVFGVPFEVTLHRQDDTDGCDATSSSRLVTPGSTEKLILPIPRIRIPSSRLSQPIPSLTDRQYVVDKSRKSPDQIKLERELFWYRDALLKTLHATWVEPSSMRTGHLSLRGQPLNLPLLDVLKKDDIELKLSHNGETPVRATDFVDIVAETANRLERPIRLRITVEPLSSTSTDLRSRNPPATLKNLMIDGSRSKVTQSLQPGERETHTVPLLFMAKGQYTFRAIAQEVSDESSAEGLTKLSAVLTVNVG